VSVASINGFQRKQKGHWYVLIVKALIGINQKTKEGEKEMSDEKEFGFGFFEKQHNCVRQGTITDFEFKLGGFGGSNYSILTLLKNKKSCKILLNEDKFRDFSDSDGELETGKVLWFDAYDEKYFWKERGAIE